MMKRLKKILQNTVLLLLAAVLLTTSCMAVSFPDVDENASYVSAIEYVSSLGIMIGNGKGNFNPDKVVTRAEMATIICRVLGETTDLETSTVFTDVPPKFWGNRYISRAASLGIVKGYGNGRFAPNDPVTCEQALTMIIRALGLEDLALDAGGYPAGYLRIAEEFGFTRSVTASPKEGLPRYQVAIILYNIAF